MKVFISFLEEPFVKIVNMRKVLFHLVCLFLISNVLGLNMKQELYVKGGVTFINCVNEAQQFLKTGKKVSVSLVIETFIQH